MKRVLVIGGSSPLGDKISSLFLDNNWEVYSTYNKSKRGKGELLFLDVTSYDSFVSLRKEIASLDSLIYVSGIFTESLQEDLDDEDFDRVFGVNIKGFYYAYKAFLPLLKESDGSIVAISSLNAFHPGFKTAHYDASKGALSSYVRSLSLESGLRINAVCPSLIYRESLENTEIKREYESHSIRGELLRGEEVASLVYFLSQSESIYGQSIVIDNGYTLK